MVKKLYLSGDEFHKLTAIFAGYKGVEGLRAGYINSSDGANYKNVINGSVGGRLGIEISYNPKWLDVSSILDKFFEEVTPYSPDGQGKAHGSMYRAGVFYTSTEDEPLIALHLSFLAGRGKPAATGTCLNLNDPNSSEIACRVLYATMERLKSFQVAEEKYQPEVNTIG